ncbi:MAG: DUF262 domain-containing protein [Chloroflexaceae bacterium]|nr:DUF262 domain-containing protein [Chloroflexaceae bacterium]
MEIRQQQVSLDFDEVDEIEHEFDNGSSVPLKYLISSYGADYTADGLVKRISQGAIVIPPFQRNYVWDILRASRFVESLLLGLPVPGIFLVRDQVSQQLLVIDGQQRLLSLAYFYDETFQPTGKPFALKGVQPQFEGKTYQTLLPEDRRRLDDAILHATIVKQEDPLNDDSSMYHVFERLNTGGVRLQPHEIRAAIYHGPLNDLLQQLNTNEAWRSVYGDPSQRMRDQELIVRFLALYFHADTYSRPLNEFLNAYMRKNRELELQSADELRQVFISTIELIHRCLGTRAFRPRRTLQAAVFDAVMVGVARRLAKGPLQDCAALRTQYEHLLNQEAFLHAIDKSSDEENVRRRLEMATDAFATVP